MKILSCTIKSYSWTSSFRRRKHLLFCVATPFYKRRTTHIKSLNLVNPFMPNIRDKIVICKTLHMVYVPCYINVCQNNFTCPFKHISFCTCCPSCTSPMSAINCVIYSAIVFVIPKFYIKKRPSLS